MAKYCQAAVHRRDSRECASRLDSATSRNATPMCSLPNDERQDRVGSLAGQSIEVEQGDGRGVPSEHHLHHYPASASLNLAAA